MSRMSVDECQWLASVTVPIFRYVLEVIKNLVLAFMTSLFNMNLIK